MRWYEDLYVGYNLLENKRKIMRKIEKGKPMFNKYVITLPENDYDTLEIYPSNVLIQKWYKNSDKIIVGIAEGKEEASALAEALLHCADRLEQERSEPLEVVWNAELGAWAAQTVLSREEAKKLLSFAKEQGFPDRERQRQWMLRLSGEFKSRAESVFEKAASEKRMVLSVSLAAGALVVVLFW